MQSLHAPAASRWSTVLQTTISSEKKRLEDVRIERPPHRRYEYEDLPEYKSITSDGRRRLEALMRALNHLYTRGGVRLGYLQKRLMKAIITSIIKRIFGPQLLDNYEYLLTVQSLEELFDAVVILFPRRSGKTTVQTIAAPSIAVSQPDGNQCVFNITGRQARMWLSQARGYLMLFQTSDEFCFVFVQENMNEFIKIKSVAAGTVNTISAYPGGQGKDFKNLRGVGEKIMVVYVDEGCWFAEEGVPVLIPLTANGAALVITSSVGSGGPRAGLMAILDAKYSDGTSAVKEVNYAVTCEECKAAGVPEGNCPHPTQQKPQHFQSHQSMVRTKTLLEPFEGDLHAREILNQQDKPPTEPVWGTRSIMNMFDTNKDLRPLQEFSHAFVSIDPHGGGKNSDSVIVTGARLRENERWIVMVRIHFIRSSSSSSSRKRSLMPSHVCWKYATKSRVRTCTRSPHVAPRSSYRIMRSR